MHIGSTISHYKIVEKLGEGGMGVVYKAQDTKLNRQVALKFLAEHLLGDNEAKERFLREAQAAAALHHPNICPVYEIDEVDGKTFISMAFLKGETLEERIAKGPLAIKDALDIARQVADGLQAAHAEGIVHRDIKPANIIVSPEGRPTIMDFGLARLTEASRLTKVDTAMGTVAYMSPEQAQGMAVDSRSDIWALGCVLYEMVSGQRPFQGMYDQALLYEIVHEQVAPLTSIRAGVPMELEFIVGECLAKDRDDRTGTAQEVSRKLRTLAEKVKSGHSTILRTTQMTGAVPATMTGAHTLNPAATLPPDAMVLPRTKYRGLLGLAALMSLAMLVFAVLYFTQAPPEQPTRRFSFAQSGLTTAAISPDGRSIAFVANTEDERSVWLRAIGTETAQQIRGTEDARPQLGWSPDSQAIVFATRTEIKRVGINGVDPITLGDLPGMGSQGFRGVTWSPDGERIVFSSAGGALYEIPARGGEPELIVRERNASIREPHFLPRQGGPEALVYQVGAEAGSQIWVVNLETGEQNEIGPGSAPVYSRDGYLIHGSGDAGEVGLFALPFSLSSLQATGEAFPIAEGGQIASVSEDGTLIYLDGVGRSNKTLVWRDRAGAVLETVGQPQPGLRNPALSPDGRRVVVVSPEAGTGLDVWIQDLARSTKTRLTFGGGQTPAWSPAGDQIVYWRRGLMRKAADGTGDAVALVESEQGQGTPAPDWSRDGRYLVYQHNIGAGSSDVMYVEIGADGTAGKPVTFLATPATEAVPKLSPDGRFVAYVSDESGRLEVYVRPFPDGAGRWQASVDGGGQPRWSRDGKELFYVRDTTLMSVSVETGEGVTLGQQQELFQSDDLRVIVASPVYDVSSDGQRFLTTAPADQSAEAAPPTIRVVQNWYEEFRNRKQ